VALPQQVQTNLVLIERLNGQLHANRDNQARLLEEKHRLARQPAQPSRPDAVGTEGERSLRLQQELNTLRGQFTDRYPDVRQLRAEIAADQKRQRDAVFDPGLVRKPADDATLVFAETAIKEQDHQLRVLATEEKQLKRAIAARQREVYKAPEREQELAELLPG